jgi:quercetin 2,3-dioxygenase
MAMNSRRDFIAGTLPLLLTANLFARTGGQPSKGLTMKSIYHSAESRGQADHGWLKARHSFSFANYYDPERMSFGALRVLNDDIIDPGKGFGTHPHRDMEIVTIPLEGDLKHQDSLGNGTVIRSGEIQVMSAGTGIQHSEFNPNQDRDVKLLQIWVKPSLNGVKPRYDQITLDNSGEKNAFRQIVSPDQEDEGVWVNQQTWFDLGDFNARTEVEFPIRGDNHGVYLFVIEGSVKIAGQVLERRDGFGVWDVEKLDLMIEENSRVLAITVPM